MGTAAFERDAVVEIDGQKYRMLRKVSDTCWQLEHSRTARISELEQEELLRMYADRKLRFANAVGGTVCAKSSHRNIGNRKIAPPVRTCCPENGYAHRSQAGHLGRVA